MVPDLGRSSFDSPNDPFQRNASFRKERDIEALLLLQNLKSRISSGGAGPPNGGSGPAGSAMPNSRQKRAAGSSENQCSETTKYGSTGHIGSQILLNAVQ